MPTFISQLAHKTTLLANIYDLHDYNTSTCCSHSTNCSLIPSLLNVLQLKHTSCTTQSPGSDYRLFCIQEHISNIFFTHNWRWQHGSRAGRLIISWSLAACVERKKEKEKSTPLGVITGASAPRGSLRYACVWYSRQQFVALSCVHDDTREGLWASCEWATQTFHSVCHLFVLSVCT